MADLNPEDLERAMAAIKKSLEDAGFSASQAASILLSFSNSAKYAAASLKNISVGLKDYHKEVRAGNAKFKDMGPTLDAAQKQINRLTNAAEREEAQKKLNMYAAVAYTQSLQAGANTIALGAAKAIGVGFYDYLKKQVFIGVKGLLGDGSPMQLAVELQSAALDSMAKTAGGVGKAFMAAGASIALIPTLQSKIVGGAIAGIGMAIEGMSAEAADIEKQRLQVMGQLADQTYASFKQAAQAGALFAGGMTELREQAALMGLAPDQFSKIIAENSEKLSSFGGSVDLGAKRLIQASQFITKETKISMGKLGILPAELAQGFVDTMDILQKSGNLQNMTDKQINATSIEYLKSLRAITAFTGEEEKKAQARAAEARAQAGVQATLAELGGEAALKFDAAIRMLPDWTKSFQQMIQGYAPTGEQRMALEQAPVMMSILQQFVAGIQDSSIGVNNFVANMQTLIAARQEEAKQQGAAASKLFGATSSMTGNYEEVTRLLGGVYQLGIKDLSKGFDTTNKKVEDAANTQDKLSNTIATSIQDFQDMKVALNKDVIGSLQKFADDVVKIGKGLKGQLEFLGILPKEVIPTAPPAYKKLEEQSEKVKRGAGWKSYREQDLEIAEKMRRHREEIGIDILQKGALPAGAGVAAINANVEDLVKNTPSSSTNVAQQIEKLTTVLTTTQQTSGTVTGDMAPKLDELTAAVKDLKNTANAQLEKHEQMIRHLQDHKDISERLLNNSY